MPRKSIADGGSANRAKDVIAAVKAVHDANRAFRAANDLGTRGRLKPGFVIGADGLIVAVEVAEPALANPVPEDSDVAALLAEG